MYDETEWPGYWYGEPIEEQIETLDPYDRPDFAARWPEEHDEDEPACDSITGLPLTPCAVCGMDTVPEGGMGFVCPICGWQAGAMVQDAWEPSACNHGLSLLEAQLNFRTFGWSDPAMLIEGEETNDAEF